MTRNALLMLPVAVMCLAAAPARPASPTGSAPSKASPAKTPPPKAATPVAAFDAQNPQSLMDLLGAAGARVQTRSREDDTVFVAVTSTAATFSMQFAGCNPQGRACRAILLDAAIDRAWGSAFVSAAGHEVHGNYYTNADSGRPASTYGYAVSGGFELKNLPTGTGDTFKMEATYAKGAAKYVWGGTQDGAG
eukprot:gene65781-90006_t